jgi:hypothetical protein
VRIREQRVHWENEITVRNGVALAKKRVAGANAEDASHRKPGDRALSLKS